MAVTKLKEHICSQEGTERLHCEVPLREDQVGFAGTDYKLKDACENLTGRRGFSKEGSFGVVGIKDGTQTQHHMG